MLDARYLILDALNPNPATAGVNTETRNPDFAGTPFGRMEFGN